MKKVSVQFRVGGEVRHERGETDVGVLYILYAHAQFGNTRVRYVWRRRYIDPLTPRYNTDEDAMGNTVRAAVDYLQDPHLVRSIQERLGVKRIVTPKTVVGSKSNGGPASETGVHHERRRDCEGTSANGSVANGGGALGGGNLGWLATKRRKRLRHPVSPHLSPISSPEPEDIIVETIPALDIFFKLATELGYEPFYITVIPFLIWNVDTLVTRHMIVLWIGSMYIGQACKALLRIRRPASPPAIRLEINPSLETEYGFPSSHATVSTTIPFYAAYQAYLRYNVSCGVF